MKLPIIEHISQILSAIRGNRVVVVSGKTGCGKSTQIPKYLHLEDQGYVIGVCQPRRLSAISLAVRVSQELGEKAVGGVVGYRIGLESKCCDKTKIIFMTYGIFIQQLLFQQNMRFTHVILDQVHERSLEMDFCFIALRKILDQSMRMSSQFQKSNENNEENSQTQSESGSETETKISLFSEIKNNVKTKIVIMSATMNCQLFSTYFSTHSKMGTFLQPTITYKQVPLPKGRGGQGQRNIQIQPKVEAQIVFNREEYTCASLIELNSKTPFKITQFFADEFPLHPKALDQPPRYTLRHIPFYTQDQDVRIREETYYLALSLIHSNFPCSEQGDILVFLPGMYEIKMMKEMLVEAGRVKSQRIVEVHSAFSQELYDKLFHGQKGKVILSTNIGESSITLPDCKIVIDFCLTRKNITVKTKGYSRFETRVASKANLMQRSGRVGRVSDGTVYRLISRDAYEKLDDFQTPEIRCVSLEMVILRAKQIDKTSGSNLFEDPYEVMFNAIQPPLFSQVHNAINYLLEQEALVQKDLVKEPDAEKQKPMKKINKSSHKFQGSDLHLTEIGQFMVTMPCSIRISKMILLALQLGIGEVVVDIAAILLTQKSFFVHEEKRSNLQQFVHSLAGYDRGDFNDFLLRRRLFSHWRQNVFGHFLDTLQKRSKVVNREKAVEMFAHEKVSNWEWGWCQDRGVSPWVMRDIFKICQNIYQRLQSNGLKIEPENEEVRNELVILCLCIAFQDTTCTVNFQQRPSQCPPNSILLFENEITTYENLQAFMHPYPVPHVSQGKTGYLVLTGPAHHLQKLLLPRFHNKGRLDRVSPLYRFLASVPAKTIYTYENSQILEKNRQITVLSDSINRPIMKAYENQSYGLVSDRIFQSKGKCYMGACALIQNRKLILIKMITAKEVRLEPHPSWEFFSQVFINGIPNQMPFYITEKQISVILQFRKFSQDDRNKKLDQGKLLGESKREKFERLLFGMKIKPKIQQWTYIYNELVQKYPNYSQKNYSIESLPALKPSKPGQDYFTRYQAWKKSQYMTLNLTFRSLTIKTPSLICLQCHPSEITVIDELFSFNPEKKVLNLNQYRGSWKIHQNSLLCLKGHKLGQVLNPDECSLDPSCILIYSPYNKIHKFPVSKEQMEKIARQLPEGLQKCEETRQQIQEFECRICAAFDQYDKLKRLIFREHNTYGNSQGNSQGNQQGNIQGREQGNLQGREQGRELGRGKDLKSKEPDGGLWGRISEHMYSRKHGENCQRFVGTLL